MWERKEGEKRREKIPFMIARGINLCYNLVRNGGDRKMKEAIHPNYQKTTITCACGAVFEVGSTQKDLKVEICSKCHPFFTGKKQRNFAAAGQVEKFRKKYDLK